jgi:hypothetical protein
MISGSDPILDPSPEFACEIGQQSGNPRAKRCNTATGLSQTTIGGACQGNMAMVIYRTAGISASSVHAISIHQALEQTNHQLQGFLMFV